MKKAKSKKVVVKKNATAKILPKGYKLATYRGKL